MNPVTTEKPIAFVPYEQWLNDTYPRSTTSAHRSVDTTSARARRRIAAMLVALGGWVGGTPPGILPELQPPDTDQHAET